MITIYAFVVAAMLPNGKMVMSQEFVSACPEQLEVAERMQAIVDSGTISKWSAICFKVPNPNEQGL